MVTSLIGATVPVVATAKTTSLWVRATRSSQVRSSRLRASDVLAELVEVDGADHRLQVPPVRRPRSAAPSMPSTPERAEGSSPRPTAKR